MTDRHDNLVSQLKRHEGYRRFPYKDTVGVLTVGVGRNLEEVGIYEDEAEMMLENDVEKRENRLREELSFWTSLSDVRKNVLSNMAFNLGVSGLLSFTSMLEAVENENWEKASEEMLNSKWANQVGGRANELAKQMENNTYKVD